MHIVCLCLFFITNRVFHFIQTIGNQKIGILQINQLRGAVRASHTTHLQLGLLRIARINNDIIAKPTIAPRPLETYGNGISLIDHINDQIFVLRQQQHSPIAIKHLKTIVIGRRTKFVNASLRPKRQGQATKTQHPKNSFHIRLHQSKHYNQRSKAPKVEISSSGF